MDQSVHHTVLVDARQAGRYDLYLNIHRALRLYLTDTLNRFGRLDADDVEDRTAALGQLRDMLEICELHIEDENRFVHAALEARRPGSSARIAAEHVEHQQAIAALRADAARLERAPEGARQTIAVALYRRLALFVAENLEHMHVEETAHMQALWSDYADEELMAIEQRIVASIPPALMGRLLEWFMPALPHSERLAMLTGMRDHAPAPVFDGAAQIARQRLPEHDWRRLANALAIA